MKKKNNVKDILLNEFTCFYHSDFISLDTTDELFLKNEAISSIERISYYIDPSEISELLMEMINNRNHEFNHFTEEACNFEWTIEDSEWEFYKKLLTEIYISSCKK